MIETKKHVLRWFWIIVFQPFALWASGDQIDIARFSSGELSGWRSKVFSGETRYSFEHQDGRIALRADSHTTASGLFREVDIDLNKTPVLNWEWKIANILIGNNERTKAGDDYPARIYVVFSDGVRFWRTRAINYIWSNNQPIDDSWFNAYTHNAGMIVVESGSIDVGIWKKEQRNVLADYRRLFGEEPDHVNAVAIMTDTDNTGGVARAWYGDIWFTAK